MRFETNICYAKVGKDSHDNVTSVTIGERIHMPDKDGKSTTKVDGNTFRCTGATLEETEKPIAKDGPIFDDM